MGNDIPVSSLELMDLGGGAPPPCVCCVGFGPVGALFVLVLERASGGPPLRLTPPCVSGGLGWMTWVCGSK